MPVRSRSARDAPWRSCPILLSSDALTRTLLHGGGGDHAPKVLVRRPQVLAAKGERHPPAREWCDAGVTPPTAGSVALITGGTGGFGRALATKLREREVTAVLA